MKTKSLFLIGLCLSTFAFAQQPFERYGYQVEISTLSKGRYIEDFTSDSLVQVGTVLINRVTGKIASFITYDTVYSEATLDPQLISRWMSPDPLAHELYDQSPYSYAMNNPILFIDPDGRFPFTFHIRSFAPFKTFGGGFKGDGADRKFSTQSDAKFKIAGQAQIETNGMVIQSSKGIGSQSAWTPGGRKLVSAFSEAKFDVSGNDATNFDFHLSGNNDAMLWGATPDIDTKGSVLMNFAGNEDGSGILNIDGSVFGDKFPASEAFITDASGNSIFLGVSGADGSPLTSLPGNNDREMSSFNIGISFDADGNATGVTYGDTNYSISDWNKQFEDLNPQSGSVSSKFE